MRPSRLSFRLPWRTADRLRAELDDELRFHAEERARELAAQGMSAPAAREQAEREFGDLGALRRECLGIDQAAQRDERRTALATELADDLRAAWRAARRSRGTSLAAVLALALGIGATTAIFTVVDAVLLERLPYAQPGRLVGVFSRSAERDRGQIAAGDFVDFRARQRTLADVAAWAPAGYVWAGAGDPQMLPGMRVSPHFFALLGVAPAAGRAFVDGEDAEGAAPVAVLSHGAWQRHFGGDPAVVGRTLQLGGVTRTVVGILPEGFVFPLSLRDEPAVYVPLAMHAVLADVDRARKFRWLGVVGRLRPGATVEEARADLATIAAALARDHPESNEGFSATALSLRETRVGDVRTPLLVLLAASALLLLIACANVAGLLLSRAVARRREFAIRAALGAGRRRLARQALLESVLLALGGGVLGLLLAHGGTRLLLALDTGVVPTVGEVAVDGRVLAFTLLVAVATGLLFGLAPALGVPRDGLRAVLQEGARGATGGEGLRLRAGLVLAQTALAVMLVVGAGLLGRSLLRLQQEELGFVTERALTFRVSLPGARYGDAALQNAFFETLQERLRALPGVTAAASMGILPVKGGGPSASLFVAGRDAPGTQLPEVGYASVSAGLFEALGVPLRQGRAFAATDRADGPPVAVVNEALVRRHFPRGDAVGRRIRLGPDPSVPLIEIVGVVGDVRQDGATMPPRATAYVLALQDSWGGRDVVVRTTGDPLAVVAAARRLVRELDPALPVLDVQPLDAIVRRSLDGQRLPLLLMGSFALVALALAALGVYGVTAYAVAARTREFGVRLALGATRRRVLALAVRQGALPAAVGVALGLAAAAALGGVLRGLLHGVQPLDAATFVAVPVALLALVLVACWLPALRATRVDPASTLRAE